MEDSQNQNMNQNMNAPQGDNDKSPDHIQIDGTAGGAGPDNGGHHTPEAPEASSHRPITSEFPSDFFPLQLEQFRQSTARSIGIAAEYVAGPMIAAASSAIGTSLTAVLKRGWEEPVSVFVGVVGEKSSGKTPAFKAAFRPLHEEQNTRELRFAAESAAAAAVGAEGAPVTIEILSNLADQRNGIVFRMTETPPCSACSIVAPKPLEHLIATDTTHAALWGILQDSPRGVGVITDELSLVFLQGTAASRQVWCELYQAGSRTVHRRSNRNGPIILERTFVTLAGGIQPDLFSTIRGKYDGGLLERFLICGTPGTSLPPWVTEEVDPDLELCWDMALKSLLRLDPAKQTDPGGRPGFVRFTPRAYARLGQLHDDLLRHLNTAGVPVSVHGIVRKLVANAGRLALIRRALRWASGEFGVFGPIGVVDEDDCDVACRAAEFFLTRYILWTGCGVSAAVPDGMSPATGQTVLAEQILEFLQSKGRTEVEVRWIRQQTLRGNPSTEAIQAALDAAVALGKGRWADAKKRKFVRT